VYDVAYFQLLTLPSASIFQLFEEWYGKARQANNDLLWNQTGNTLLDVVSFV
jgi:hypothetical protein